MQLSATDRGFLKGQFPEFEFAGLTDRELDEMIDAWYAHDHYDDNPVYVGLEDEESAQ